MEAEKRRLAEKQAAVEAKKRRHELAEKRWRASDAQHRADEAAKARIEQADANRAAYEAYSRADKLLAQKICNDKGVEGEEDKGQRSHGPSDAPGPGGSSMSQKRAHPGLPPGSNSGSTITFFDELIRVAVMLKD